MAKLGASTFSAVIVLVGGNALAALNGTLTAPPHWSGMNCRLSGTAITRPSTNEILGYQIIANGTTIRDVLFEDGVRQHLTVSARIDSTHFSPNSTVGVEVRFLGNDEAWYSHSLSVPVKNRIIGFDRADFAATQGGDGAPIVASILGGTGGYDSYATQTAGWTREDILSRLNNAGVVYVCSHGTLTEDYKANLLFMLDSTYHWLCQDHSSTHPPIDAHCRDEDEPNTILPKRPTKWIYPGPEWRPTNYQSARETANGTGNPPYNSTGNPPTFLLMLDTCYNASNNNFIRIMWPYLDAYNEWLVNRAYTGWSGWSRINQTTAHATECFSLLASGYTIGKMRDDMVQDNVDRVQNDAAFSYEIAYSGYFDEDNEWQENWQPVLEVTDWPIWGDHFTRVHGVYTGTHSTATNFWYL